MSYTMTSGLGVVLGPSYHPSDTGDCYSQCELECMKETEGLYIPFVTTYCAADCYDSSGCQELPRPESAKDYPDLPTVVLPPDEPATTKPTTSGSSTKPSSGGKTSSSSSNSTKNGGSDDEPSPVAPSGTKIGVVLLGLSAAIFGGVWWMRRRRR